MKGEIERQTKEIVKDKDIAEQVMRVINTAGREFPCLSCPSKDECKTFNWFIKWFGTNFSTGEEA
ncbi:MAG TPA: hypothetical protein VMS94_05690 [Acidobacteriota bacterium]|nr:hypothetical protein [Acidobacteriota bacterium]